MDYNLIYKNLILKARERNLQKNIYFEKHHIIPRCMGGNNDQNNIVKLTAREHFVAHWILTKIYNKEWKLFFAFFQMTKNCRHERILNSRQFEIARKALSEGARMRYNAGLHPRITTKGRKVLSDKMKGNLNPMRKNPEKNHTAREHIVIFNDGTSKKYQYGKIGYIELGISRATWIDAVKKGRPVPKFNISKIFKVE